MSGKKFIYLLVLLVLCGGGNLHAQMNNEAPDEFLGLDRWAFKTNVLGWASTLPNFSFEYDLSPSPYNRSTLSLGARYNWETAQSILPYNTFNLLSVRPEYRYYVRTPESSDMKKIARREKGAYYFGAYLDAGTYTFKLSETGYQGIHAGLGASFGFAMPMYQYRKGCLDVEFGFSLGLAMATSDAFVLNDRVNTYDHVEPLSKGFHLVPYPVVSELSIAFVWRRTSIKHKYLKVDLLKAQEKLDKKERRHAPEYN